MAKLRVDKIAAPIVKDEFTGSVYFDGSSDYLSLPVSSDFQFGSGDFTIECWAYALDEGTDDILGIYNTGSNRRTFALRKDQTEAAQFLFSTDGSSGTSIASAASVIQLRTWHHYAVVRRNLVYELYFDGVKVATKSDSTGAIYTNNDDGLRIGSSYNTDFHGYISNVRICKGHAVYDGNFTPPTRELDIHLGAKGVVFPAADNRTVLLACQSSTDTTAEATGRHILTANGNATAADANPGLLRKTNITSTITENTGSVFFDGSGDRLIIPTSTDLNLTGDFTIECWVYINSVDSINYITFFNTSSDGNYSAETSIFWGASEDYFAFQNKGTTLVTATMADPTNAWYHIAVTRSGSTTRMFLNGKQTGSTTTSWDAVTGQSWHIGDRPAGATSGNYPLNGYISNLRVCKGHAVYTSDFAPPTRELEVHQGPDDDRTVLLACYDGENIFADKTGRHIIAAYGDRLSSPTPTATDSPIGITTFQPGLTRNVDPTAGPTFQGGAGFTSQNWLTLPKGTTTERMPSFGGDQSGTRGFFAGAYSPTRSDVINYVTVPTLGNAIDFGNLGAANGGTAGFSDSTRGWIAGGNIAPARTNVMEYVTMASSGNAIDGGDLITGNQARPGSVSNSIRGIVAGGGTPGQVKTIVHHTIQTTGIVQDFGDLTEAKQQLAGVMSPTRGVFAGGRQPGAVDTIEYVTIASTGNAVLFGELSLDDRGNMGGASNTVRGLFGGGRSPTDFAHIEYITIATLGDAKDFGDLTQSGMDGDVGAVSNSTRVVFGGGASDELGYVEIATLGDTTDFGKFTVQTNANQDPGCFSSGHGGLG